MNQLLAFQILTSFIVGGAFISFLSLLAERTSEKISGIILMSPSTIVLGFFFLGWAVGTEATAAVVPAGLVPLGFAVLSAAVYIYTAGFLSKRVRKKSHQVFLTALISTLVWLMLSIPLAIIQLSNLPLAVAGYLALVLITHFLLDKDHEKEDLITPSYSPLQKLYRASFMGSVIALIVFLGKTLNPFWGGIMIMFPAAVFSTLIFFHLKYSPKRLFRIMKKGPTGSFSLLAYSLSVMIFFPRIGFLAGTLVSYAIGLSFSVFLAKISTR